MARKAIVDRDRVLQMLRDGQTTQRIADYFGVSRQAVDLHRKDFIARGLLADQRASRSPRTAPLAAPQTPLVPPDSSVVQPAERIEAHIPPAPSHRELAAMPLDQIIDLAIDAFTALKKLPEVEAERDRYRESYQAAAAEIDRLKEAESHRHAQEQRWLHARK